MWIPAAPKRILRSKNFKNRHVPAPPREGLSNYVRFLNKLC